jgi:hypothetical protein
MHSRASTRARPALSPDSRFLLACCVLSGLLAVWMTWGIWQPGVPVGDDTAAHLVRADYAFSHFFPHQADGWQTSFGLGYQEFLFLGPVFTLVVGVVKVVSLGTVSTLDAFKATIVLSFVLLPLALAFLAWCFGLGKRAAGVAALLTMTVSSVFGGAGLSGVFQSGLVPQQLGSVWLFFGLGGVVLVMRRPTLHRVLFAGACVAVLVATHPIATIILGFLATSILIGAGLEWAIAKRSTIKPALQRWARTLGDEADPPTRRHEGAEGDVAGEGDAALIAPHDDTTSPLLSFIAVRLLALAAAALISASLAGFVLFPLAMHGDLRGENSAWGDVALTTQLTNMWKGEFLIRPWVALILLIGFAFTLALAVLGRRMALTLVLTPVIFLVLGRIFINATPDNAIAIQLTNRSFADVMLIALLPLATMIAAPRRTVSRTIATAFGTPLQRHPLYAIADGLVPILLALAVVVLPPHLGRDRVGAVKPSPTLAEAATVLARVVPPDARFATQRDFPREYALTGMSHPDLWLASATGRDTLNIFNLESSTVFEPVYETENLTTEPPEKKARTLARLGITHLLIINADTAGGIPTSSAFKQVWTSGPMRILEVLTPDGQPAPASRLATSKPATATLTQTDPEHVTIDATTSAATDASIAMAWSSKWHVWVNGQEVAPAPTADHLLSVRLPEGSSRIELAYGPDRADAMGRFVTLFSIACVAYVLWLTRKPRAAVTVDEPAVEVDPIDPVPPEEDRGRLGDLSRT